MTTVPRPATVLFRSTALRWAVADCTEKSWRLRSATADAAVMTYRRGGPAVNAILDVVTCGVWRLVRPRWTLRITVDEAGKVSYRRHCGRLVDAPSHTDGHE